MKLQYTDIEKVVNERGYSIRKYTYTGDDSKDVYIELTAPRYMQWRETKFSVEVVKYNPTDDKQEHEALQRIIDICDEGIEHVDNITKQTNKKHTH